MAHSGVQDAFDKLWETGSLKVGGTASEQRSLYVQLFRKHTERRDSLTAVGYISDHRENTTLSITYRPDGTAEILVKRRRVRKVYQILGDTNENVPTDLEHDQERKVRNGNSDQDSQEHATNVDPSCSQGEDDGHCFVAEDRRENCWSTGDEDRTVSQAS